jgi:hypothetical protein
MITISPSEKEVLELARKHAETWRDQPESYWFCRLMEEVGELGASLEDDHDDPPEWELRQIASICLNWLEMRKDRLGEDWRMS